MNPWLGQGWPRIRTCAGLALLAGAGAAASQDSEPKAGDDAGRPGHARMAALLDEVYGRARDEDPYLGDGRYRALAEQLAQLDANAAAEERAHLAFQVGTWALRAGLFEEAIAAMEESESLLAALPRRSRPAFEPELFYVLGVTHLRYGETKNCVALHSSESCLLPIEGRGVHVDQEGSRQALKYFGKVLRRESGSESLRLASLWLFNIAAMTVGEYPDGVEPELRIPPETFESKVAFPRFEEVAPGIGLNTFNLAGGALAGDFDGDGSVDLVHSSWDPAQPVRLHRRGADGRFRESAETGLGDITGGLNLVHADYDNDGDLDVLVLRGAWRVGRAGEIPNSLLRNDGGGTFTDVTFAAGLGEQHYPTQTAAFADYDNDGDLDLYIGNECRPHESVPSQLFRNAGDGTFVEVGRAAGVANWRYAKGVTWGDYDGDRYPDLFVSNLGGRNRLYHNEGDGTFVDKAKEAGVREPMDSFPCWFWDFDNDGALDLYVSSYFDSDGLARLAPAVASYLGTPLGSETARLYRGDGRGGFEDVTASAGLERVSMPMGANFGDLDNDGRLDFYLGTGYPFFDGLMPNVMYWNRGAEGFADVTTSGGFGHLQKGHGVVFVDLDGDGDQDVFEQMGGAFRGDEFGNVLYENPGFGNHWLKLELVGVRSNRSAIGARIRLDFEDGEEPRSVFRHVSTGASFGGNSLVQHLGTGAAERVRLEVYWPTSDSTQVFEDVAVDRSLRIVEGAADYAVVVEPRRAFPK